MKKRFSIHNKSSERMSEVQDASVDLIYTSPPYNIGTSYQKNVDNINVEDYIRQLKNVFSECHRILKDDGRLIVEVADSIVTHGKYIQLAGFIQSYCVGLGLSLIERHINFVNSTNGKELPEHGWDDGYIAQSDAHSNCHQIVVFSKTSNGSFKKQGKVLYINYESTPEHPCPIPEEMRDFILNNYFEDGMDVVDPFMGTALLGKDVLLRDGFFIGYEIDSSIFGIAKQNLESVDESQKR